MEHGTGTMKGVDDDKLKIIAQSAPLIRESVETGNLEEFAQFLQEQGMDIPKERLSEFRDYVILRRPDCMDLIPAARARLREKCLSEQDVQPTVDYLSTIMGEVELSCGDCKHFTNPPMDGDGVDEQKPCLQLGALHDDSICYGFVIAQ